MPTPTERKLLELDRDIAKLRENLQTARRKRYEISTKCSMLSIWYGYLRLAQALRLPASTVLYWPAMVLLIGPILVGVIAFIVSREISGTWVGASRAMIFSYPVTLVVLLIFLMYPAERCFRDVVADTIDSREDERRKLVAAREAISSIDHQLRNSLHQKSCTLRSSQLAREQLLAEEWKAMRDSEWEDFLERVFVALGARVQRTGRSGDQGIDLVAEFGARRIAVQAKGYYHSVDGSAVQQAVAGVAVYGCNASAVITNSRFTKGAQELARCNRCTLIGEDEIPAFVLGSHPICATPI